MKRTILIVEDDAQSLYMLTFLLESNNYEVVQANTGLEGIKKAKNQKPDAIILDIQLPEMDGYKVARELRSSEEGRHIPIIVVTSFAMVGDRNKAMEAGATGYIEKPINPDTFISQMESYLVKT